MAPAPPPPLFEDSVESRSSCLLAWGVGSRKNPGPKASLSVTPGLRMLETVPKPKLSLLPPEAPRALLPVAPIKWKLDKASLFCFHPSISDHVRGVGRVCTFRASTFSSDPGAAACVPPHATHYPPNCAAKRIWQTLLSYIHMCKHLQARMKRVLGFLISRRISASIVLKSGPAGSHEVGKDAHSV